MWESKTIDACLRVFLDAANAWGLEIPAGGRVLEVGCAEADWMTIASAHQPNAEIIGVDVRAAERPGTVIRGDIFEQSFRDLDAVVFVSALEHIGLGHYGDPEMPDGDRVLLARCREWLKPGGWIYADVPWTADAAWTNKTEYRVYASDSLRAAFRGFDERGWRWYTKQATVLNEAQATPRAHERQWVYLATWWTKG